MSVVINTNYAATIASNNLAASNANLQKSLNRLSSGSKIVNPSDDAGGLAVSMKLSAAALGNLAAEKFNGIALFGSSDLVVNSNEDASQQITATAVDLATDTSGLAIDDLDGIKTAIESVATSRANNGAFQSVLGFASEVLTVNKANLEAATSRITDVDVAEESTQLARWNILVQSGTAMLAQANQSAQTALRLLQ